MRMIGRCTRSLVDLLFPPACKWCGGWDQLDEGRFCLTCLDHLSAERGEEACPACAATVAPFEISRGECGRCRKRPTRVGGTARVGPYGPYLGRLLRTYKYRARQELEPILGGWLTEAVEKTPWRKRVEAVVSVPTHWRRRLGRPFHAADSLAAFVARQLGLPHVPLLQRTRSGPHQIGLSYTQRAENVLGAFAVRRGVGLRDARLLLVDDVKTTGATIDECAKVLRRAGAAEVYAAVVEAVGWTPGTGGPLKTI